MTLQDNFQGFIFPGRRVSASRLPGSRGQEGGGGGGLHPNVGTYSPAPSLEESRGPCRDPQLCCPLRWHLGFWAGTEVPGWPQPG